MSSKKRKRNTPANADILREQINLVQTEKELKSALETIKENMNRLLVITIYYKMH